MTKKRGREKTMIVRTIDEVLDSDRNVEAPTFASRRFLLKKDGMGFSLR